MTPVRIVRVDERNFAVQELADIEATVKGKKTGEVRREWRDSGYFGHRLDHAARFAVLRAAGIGEIVTEQFVNDAVAMIVQGTKDVLQ